MIFDIFFTVQFQSVIQHGILSIHVKDRKQTLRHRKQSLALDTQTIATETTFDKMDVSVSFIESPVYSKLMI